MSTTDTSAASDTSGAGAGLLPDGWELVVGLEVHAELLTATKMFSAAPNAFGSDPNTNIDPTTLGLPGSLPVLNHKAVELAIRLGLALNCSVEPSVFARKNYFYPDMPKDFQISQYDKPINVDGWLELPDGTRIGVERAHLEEDTGKSTHMGGSGRIQGADYSLVDYNRAGVPLLEIVSRPDIRTAEQARAYVAELRAILVATGVSDGKMEEGSMRVDANVSVHEVGTDFGTRCEIKNLNSLRSLGRAIEYEARRQYEAVQAGESIRQETRHWDDTAGRTSTMRVKEEAEDYRYFPEPDLVPLEPSAGWVEEIRAALPVLPSARRARLADATGADRAADAVAVLVERGLDDLVLAAVDAGADGSRALVHAEQNLTADAAGAVTAEAFARLVAMETGGELTATQAKAVLAAMVDGEAGGDPQAIAEAKGFEAVGGDVVDQAVDDAIAANPDAWAKYCAAVASGDEAGAKKVSGAFVGPVMKATKGNANGGEVMAILARKAAATT
ncbi:MAG TPA: Asp-tRNA(Asn)/Glu-tRNA(Gln) amidotransferase subunit GatB [Acidimicrobiales bacterium]|jgi:aspartyl-tRNA(Asn)/glutamyl-tRNA(Gln) amidotransferase subunit B|nr:Asp-tRNA(Asn)/Glu-tRNA(Gln) amidotransferase subunit GatB [Acidimicrobiales bacterium]